MTIVLSGTLKAQENKGMKTVFNEVDAKIIKSHNSNPWGLVYRDAITKNEPDKVNIHPITYDLGGEITLKPIMCRSMWTQVASR